MRELLFTIKRMREEISKHKLLMEKSGFFKSELDMRKLEAKLDQTNEICKMIKEDIELQKKSLKKDSTAKNFEENKPFMWRIHGFQALLSRITGEHIELYTNSEKEIRNLNQGGKKK